MIISSILFVKGCYITYTIQVADLGLIFLQLNTTALTQLNDVLGV